MPHCYPRKERNPRQSVRTKPKNQSNPQWKQRKLPNQNLRKQFGPVWKRGIWSKTPVNYKPKFFFRCRLEMLFGRLVSPLFLPLVWPKLMENENHVPRSKKKMTTIGVSSRRGTRSRFRLRRWERSPQGRLGSGSTTTASGSATWHHRPIARGVLLPSPSQLPSLPLHALWVAGLISPSPSSDWW
jgi:hypothetical protein